MKTFAVRLAVVCSVFAFAGCNLGNSAHRDDHQATPGEQAGHAAYIVEKDGKKAAKEVAQDLKTFSHDAREGFKDEKQKDQDGAKLPKGEAAK